MSEWIRFDDEPLPETGEFWIYWSDGSLGAWDRDEDGDPQWAADLRPTHWMKVVRPEPPTDAGLLDGLAQTSGATETESGRRASLVVATASTGCRHPDCVKHGGCGGHPVEDDGANASANVVLDGEDGGANPAIAEECDAVTPEEALIDWLTSDRHHSLQCQHVGRTEHGIAAVELCHSHPELDETAVELCEKLGAEVFHG